MKHKILYALIILIITFGIGLAVYPAISAFVADYTSTKVIIDYQAKTENQNNRKAAQQHLNTKKLYDKISQLVDNPYSFYKKEAERLNPGKPKEIPKAKKTEYRPGEMEGYITIPDIDVTLPIYEGTKENVLYKGAGHLIGSSLPSETSSKGTHCVITGHSGLSTATLFSRLEELTINDVFYIFSEGKELKYMVDRIKIIKPFEADRFINIDKNKNYCTLITCTPITINTHRLLVRGRRIANDGKIGEIIHKKIEAQNNTLAVAALVAFAAAFFIHLIYKAATKKKRRIRQIKAN